MSIITLKRDNSGFAASRSPDASANISRQTTRKIRPFQLKKEISAGGNKKMNQRTVFSGGARDSFPDAGAGLDLCILLGIGSSLVVNSSQTKTGLQRLVFAIIYT